MATQAVDKVVCRSCEASLGGVCAGLAERFDLDPIVVRILAVFITLLTAGLGLLVYVALWVRLPRDSQPDAPYEVLPESAESSAFGSVDCSTGRAIHKPGGRSTAGISLAARLAIAVGLMLLFLAAAMNLSPLMPGTEWWQFWPLALIIAGLCLIIIPVPSRYEAVWHGLGIVVTSFAATLLPVALEIISWQMLPLAFSQAWPLLLAAVLMLAFGLYRKMNALIIGSAFFVVAFCVFALVACSIPGDAQAFTLLMPDGSFMKIAFIER